MAARWSTLPKPARQAILAGAAVEGALKVAALVDLVRRPGEQVRGPKVGWAAAIILVNSVGAVPIAYFLRGRRRAAEDS